MTPRVRAAGLLAALAVGGCTPGATPSAAGTDGTPAGPAAAPAPSPAGETVPADLGPLAGLRWPGGPLPAGTLLHDDGRRLETVDPDSGHATPVWEHPRVATVALGVSPDRTRVALAVQGTQAGTGAGASPTLLYLLDVDGTVRSIDRADPGATIDTPVWLREPHAVDGSPDPVPADPVLHWVVARMKIDEAGRADTHVRRLAGATVSTVEMPLRHQEAPLGLYAYPGSVTWLVSLFRQDNVPTRLEIVQDDDYRASTASDADHWGLGDQHRAFTDSLVGPVWISPTEYVVPVYDDTFPDATSWRLFRHNCEWAGSVPVYRGVGIDPGYAELSWHPLAAGRRVFVVAADDARAAGEAVDAGGPAATVPWSVLDLDAGTLSPAGFDRTPGAWTAVPSTDPGTRLPWYDGGCGQDDYAP